MALVKKAMHIFVTCTRQTPAVAHPKFLPAYNYFLRLQLQLALSCAINGCSFYFSQAGGYNVAITCCSQTIKFLRLY